MSTTIMPIVGFVFALSAFFYGASESEPIFYGLAFIMLIGAGLAGGPEV